MPAESIRTERKGSARKPIQKATVVKSARENQSNPTSTVDKKILDRIQKCLDRAYHVNTTELEAKAALFLSQKLMNQHNVSQADLMAIDNNSSKAHFGGRSIVSITKIAGSSRKVMKEAFVGKVARAMCTFFDCKHFSTDYSTHVDWTFFGIASNTAAAAMSFEMAHNNILEWACAYKGGTPTFSYRLGAADGLVAMANREKKRELRHVRRKELDFIAAKELEDAKERQSQLDRLRLLPAPLTDTNISSLSSSDSAQDSMNPDSNMADFDSDSDNELEEGDGFGIKADFNTDDAQVIDLCDDIEESIQGFLKREPAKPSNPFDIPKFKTETETSIKTEPKPQSMPVSSPWKSGMQLVQFRATAEQVADDYLKEHKIKLRRGRKRTSTIRDLNAYRRGQKDSSKIEFHRLERD
ncbi:uncharacterized protein N7479_004087 [Penicillium vulpinum]|uniref:Uncharacterized protein n=1 Tax=Penicillium vulpinum TaxID=29845 RepID=A0A1V6SCY9_9EURO|nr:uncharacterized protein N7479_004087 [Penicillium vulpinum]KAJ5964211.1 hypothetical protein N7479_004087 [Penicillium vulpinum]OQE11778.1 hypothetical protein PENVUL_c002G05381 [Penicillium vulpinum]